MNNMQKEALKGLVSSLKGPTSSFDGFGCVRTTAVYKLTIPCQSTDVNGNIVDEETTVVFDSKEEVIEFLSGDCDGDNFGSSLLRIRSYDNKLYEEVGRTCNHIVNIFEAIDKPVRKPIRRK